MKAFVGFFWFYLKGVMESELVGGRVTAVFSCCKLIQSPDSLSAYFIFQIKLVTNC